MTTFGEQQSGPSSAEKVIALRAYEALHAAQPSIWSQYQQPSSEPGDAGTRVNLAFELGLFYGGAGRLATRVRPFGGVDVWAASQPRPAKPPQGHRGALRDILELGALAGVRTHACHCCLMNRQFTATTPRRTSTRLVGDITF